MSRFIHAAILLFLGGALLGAKVKIWPFNGDWQSGVASKVSGADQYNPAHDVLLTGNLARCAKSKDAGCDFSLLYDGMEEAATATAVVVNVVRSSSAEINKLAGGASSIEGLAATQQGLSAPAASGDLGFAQSAGAAQAGAAPTVFRPMGDTITATQNKIAAGIDSPRSGAGAVASDSADSYQHAGLGESQAAENASGTPTQGGPGGNPQPIRGSIGAPVGALTVPAPLPSDLSLSEDNADLFDLGLGEDEDFPEPAPSGPETVNYKKIDGYEVLIVEDPRDYFVRPYVKRTADLFQVVENRLHHISGTWEGIKWKRPRGRPPSVLKPAPSASPL